MAFKAKTDGKLEQLFAKVGRSNAKDKVISVLKRMALNQCKGKSVNNMKMDSATFRNIVPYESFKCPFCYSYGSMAMMRRHVESCTAAKDGYFYHPYVFYDPGAFKEVATFCTLCPQLRYFKRIQGFTEFHWFLHHWAYHNRADLAYANMNLDLLEKDVVRYILQKSK